MNILKDHVKPLLHQFQGILTRWTTPRSPDPETRLGERNLRLIILVAWVAFPLIALSDLYRGASFASMDWIFAIFAVLILAVIVIRRGYPRWAGALLWLGLLTLPFDPAAVYWSPGTIMITLLFTLFALLILPINRLIILPLALNLGVYVVIMVTQGKPPSPFPPDNTFSDPLSSFVAVAMAHLCIIVLAYFIRRDQAERDRLLLLVEQERADVLRQFLTHASHDLRTPLTKMKVTTYLLRRTLPEDQQTRVVDLDASVSHLQAALDGMFEMTRLDSAVDFQLRPMDLRPLLSQIVESFQSRAAANQQSLRSEIENSHLMIYGDADDLQRALANILENALTYTPEQGIICVRARRQHTQVIVEINDTGAGIPDDELPHIFDRFFRGDSARNTSTGKSGLGLAISQRIITLHQGKIEAQSRLGEGSCFTITLPAAR